MRIVGWLMTSSTQKMVMSLAVVAASSTLGCDNPSPVLGTTSATLTATPPTTAEACSGQRYVGVMPAGRTTCPSSRDSRWRFVQLFPNSTASELVKFCAYDWVASGKPLRNRLPRLGVRPPGAWLKPDCEVTAPYSHPWAAANGPRFETAFMNQVESLSAMPSVANPATKVLVVDGAVDRGFPRGGQGRSGHGRAMSTIIRNLACPTGGACLAQVSTHLALPLVRTPGGGIRTDTVQGGHFGRFTDIATALHSGVHQAVPLAGGRRIVVNMSLGWDPRWGGEIPASGWSALSPPLQAVYVAIMEARCQGALIIAAAGNDSGGPDRRNGAAYPAAWETEMAPTAAECAALGGHPGPSLTSSYTPLIYAVSGVDGADIPLGNQRPGGRARLVAPAGHVSVSEGSYRSKTLTGSSVAAAVVSAAAASVWTYRRHLDSSAVMDMVYNASVDLSRPPETCTTCTGNVRRASICRSVRDACLATSGCAAPACSAPNAYRNARATGFDTAGVSMTQFTMNSAAAVSWLPALPCTRETWSTSTAVITHACPASMLYSAYAIPYAGPQPGPKICPDCAFSGDHALIGIDPGVTLILESPTLTAYWFDGREEVFTLDEVGTMTGGNSADVHVPGLDPTGLEKVVLEFVYDQDFSTSDDLLLDP